MSARITTEELSAALEEALAQRLGQPVAIERLERRPCPYATSFPLEELDAMTARGDALRLVFKDLSRESLSPPVQNVKPELLHDPLREIDCYRDLLEPAELGTAACYGAAVDSARGRYWLFIENVPGVALWQIGELETWQAAASWLARMHERFAADGAWRSHTGHLVHHDAAFYRRWPERAMELARRNGASAEELAALERVAGRYERVVERLTSLPTTFIHGEFYPSNILVAGEGGTPRICPVDWELAGVGPGLVDLAALTTGGAKGWSLEDRHSIALAYREDGDSAGLRLPEGEFEQALDCCRLHLALQWLGWAADWTPPEEHRQDWLGEALRVAARLGL